NIPGATRTLPLALYTAMQSPGGDALALRLAMLSLALGLLGLLAAELLVRRVRRLLGRCPAARVGAQEAPRVLPGGALRRAHTRHHRAVRALGQRQEHARQHQLRAL